MDEYRLTEEKIGEFEKYLKGEECADATVEKYLRNVRLFAAWLGGEAVTKEAVGEWKVCLHKEKYAHSTINSKLASLNRFFAFAGLEGCRVKYFHVQRRMFRDDSRDLTQMEYRRLLGAARLSGEKRLELAIETIGATGIRVGELGYITVESARMGRATVELKGKVRVILLPGKLCRKLLKYAKGQRITSGKIFLTKNGKGLSRRQIWREMKRLCVLAGMEASKVFPHNLRHLFATTFYRVYGDIVKLADVLGHSSIETTRIYLITTGKEHARQIDRLGLVM